jgi:hypothetical protein
MLAFWWYSSTCRHLGIGGVSDPRTPLYAALKQAVSRYRRLKSFFTHGVFVGIDTLTHLHVLPQRNAAVALCFNLDGEPQTRTIPLDLPRLGLTSLESAAGGTLFCAADGSLTLSVTVPPLSPKLVELNIATATAGPGSADGREQD